MKKIILPILATALMFSSCDMDLDKPGSIPDTEAIETADDVFAFRNNVYSSFRALTAGSYVTNTELEMDMFMPLRDNGSRGMTFSNATINSATSDVADCYSGCYAVLKNVNYLLSKATELLDNGKLSEDEATDVKRYIAETKFIRAYIYYWLFDHYCQTYTADKANTPALGLQLVTVYNPSTDRSTYPGRSTMAETIKLINTDLNDAYNGLAEYEATDKSNLKPNSSYINTPTVMALQARVALLTGDNKTAVEKSQAVINSGYYTLCTGDDYANMWVTDEGSELIFVPFVNANESAYVGSFMNAWAYTDKFPSRVDYVPTYSTFMQYGLLEGVEDIRFDSFFGALDMNVEGTKTCGIIFIKFPGNDDLKSGSNEYKNKPKPFRLSEQYLILAEAQDNLGKVAEANEALNTLRKARIAGYADETNSGSMLTNAIREERAKELIGEGFRMSDLRRWNLGFKRDSSFPDEIYSALFPGYTNILEFYITSAANVQFTADDYRYVWPIPSDEMQVTPALKGQQNPGYN